MEPKAVRQLVAKNDNNSRQELFEAFYRRTYSIVYHILRSHENAEDITQDAFIKAFQNIHQLTDKAKFAAWLAVIASNLARNFLKREKKMIVTDELPEINLDQQPNNTEDEALRSLETQIVRKAIRELPPEQYQVVVLYYYHDLKVDEIGAMLKISPGTVKSRLYRAREKMSHLLERDCIPACHNSKGGERSND